MFQTCFKYNILFVKSPPEADPPPAEKVLKVNKVCKVQGWQIKNKFQKKLYKLSTLWTILLTTDQINKKACIWFPAGLY